MEHTPTPWKVVTGSVYTENDRPIANMVRDNAAYEAGIMPVERDENAHFIVKACNCHDDLVKACQLALSLSNAIIEQVSGDNIEVLMTRATIKAVISKVEV